MVGSVLKCCSTLSTSDGSLHVAKQFSSLVLSVSHSRFNGNWIIGMNFWTVSCPSSAFIKQADNVAT